jgi:hypothetical protein
VSRFAKGLGDIRTQSGRVDYASTPYRAFLKISCLEMERARLDKERDNLTRRMETIMRRVQEIDTEKSSLLAGSAAPGRATVARPICAADEEPKPRQNRTTFRFKY